MQLSEFTKESFEAIKTTEAKQLIAKACLVFGLNPLEVFKSGEDCYNLLTIYKALRDYEDKPLTSLFERRKAKIRSGK